MLTELNDGHIESMSGAMRDLADPDAAGQIANVIEG
jgi:hypothetical protein